MNDTRETFCKGSGACLFKTGDLIVIPVKPQGEIEKRVVESMFWDQGFGGWLINSTGESSPNMTVGVHEQNYILFSEVSQWEPHEAGFWSYWTKKGTEMDDQMELILRDEETGAWVVYKKDTRICYASPLEVEYWKEIKRLQAEVERLQAEMRELTDKNVRLSNTTSG